AARPAVHEDVEAGVLVQGQARATDAGVEPVVPGPQVDLELVIHPGTHAEQGHVIDVVVADKVLHDNAPDRLARGVAPLATRVIILDSDTVGGITAVID